MVVAIRLYLLIFIILVAGCVSLESTRKYYHPTSMENYSPKPLNVQVPIIEPNQIRRPYKVIGYMQFTSGYSEGFILDSVQFNARENGADAVILNQWEEESELFTSWVPFGWEGAWYSCRRPGLYSHGIYFIPEYETYSVTTYTVRAEMIVFLDKETIGYTGILFEDLRNTNYLEIGKIITGSPADLADLKKGDLIYSIADYNLDKGLSDFLENGPVFKVNEEVKVVYSRQGSLNEVTMIIHSPIK